jgi:hypothetical protein
MLRRPTNLWLAARMCCWALLVPFLKRALPIERLVRVMWAGGRNARPERHSLVIQLAWWTSRLQAWRFPENCLERSLVTYRFLALDGADPRLVFGMRRGADGLLGHAWVTVKGRAVQDLSESVHDFTQLIEFGARGQAMGAGGEAVDAKLFGSTWPRRA